MGYNLNDRLQYLEEKERIKANNKRFVMSEKKEKETQKRDKKLLFTRVKWLLHDEILKTLKETEEDYNVILYDEKLKNVIIDNTFFKLNNLEMEK